MNKPFQPPLAIFTKPWKTLPVAELGQLVSGLGFNGIEFPLRDGFQVSPAQACEKLPVLAAELARFGLTIISVASTTEERIFAACRQAGIPLIRIMLPADLRLGYLQNEKKWLRDLESILPLCEKYQVKVGIQPHYGPGVFNAMELRHLLEQCKSPYLGAIWDAAHSALAGEAPEQSLDILWEYLLLVNLKTAYYQKQFNIMDRTAYFTPCFTTGRDGASSWPRIINYLKKHDYPGAICMPAEYTDESKVEQHIREDIGYLKQLLEEN